MPMSCWDTGRVGHFLKKSESQDFFRRIFFLPLRVLGVVAHSSFDAGFVRMASCIGPSNLIQDGFHRGAQFFMAVAALAGRHHIASGAFSSASQGDHVIHGKGLSPDLLLAEMANPFLDLGFPPWSLP